MSELRYVVLRHEGVENPHFDLMFETSGESPLETWRSERWPPLTGDRLTKLAQHRREYLTYEGPLSGNRGTVARVAWGACFVLARTDRHFAVACGEGLKLELNLDSGSTWVCTVNEI